MSALAPQLQQRVAGFDEMIAPSDAEFASTGLKTASLIRLGFLAVLPEADMLGALGSISRERHQRLLGNLCRHLSA